MKTQSRLYKGAHRAERGVSRTQFHLLLSEEERKKLEKLSKRMKMSGADVVRKLIGSA